MKTKLQLAGFLYVSLALLTAYQSVATPEALAAKRAHQGNVLGEVECSLPDHQRLPRLGDGIGPYDPNNLPEPEPNHSITPEEPQGRAAYTIRAWTASWCGPCKRWKDKELPALLKAGYKVEVLDFDKDNPPKDIKAVPTVILLYKGEEIHRETNWSAKSINKYVDNRMSLKQ